jgi:transcriptional regulator with XRE-family HTH domain
MAEVAVLTEALKRALKQRRLNYEHVAKELGLSQASVKRLFSKGGFTLERFEQVCALAGTTLGGLARETVRGNDVVSQLEPEQERAIMSDRKLLLMAVCVLNHLTLDDIVRGYEITKAEGIKLLLRLEKIRFLELLPENRIRLLVTHTFSWLPNGPIQQYFKARAQNEFFRARFDRENEVMLLVNGLLSPGTQSTLVSKLKRMANEFGEQHEDEKHLPLGDRRPITLLLAMRPWELDEFRELRRPKPPEPATPPRSQGVLVSRRK